MGIRYTAFEWKWKTKENLGTVQSSQKNLPVVCDYSKDRNNKLFWVQVVLELNNMNLRNWIVHPED